MGAQLPRARALGPSWKGMAARIRVLPQRPLGPRALLATMLCFGVAPLSAWLFTRALCAHWGAVALSVVVVVVAAGIAGWLVGKIAFMHAFLGLAAVANVYAFYAKSIVWSTPALPLVSLATWLEHPEATHVTFPLAVLGPRAGEAVRVTRNKQGTSRSTVVVYPVYSDDAPSAWPSKDHVQLAWHCTLSATPKAPRRAQTIATLQRAAFAYPGLDRCEQAVANAMRTIAEAPAHAAAWPIAYFIDEDDRAHVPRRVLHWLVAGFALITLCATLIWGARANGALRAVT